MPPVIRRISLAVLAGGVLGALLLGGGGRLVMRLLALKQGIEPAFSAGGTLEIVFYGALLGAAGGTAAGLAAPLLRRRGALGGALLGLALYAGAVVTLPGHVEAAAAPFADIMALVWALFGLTFLAWGLALAAALTVLAGRWTDQGSNSIRATD